MALVLLPHLAPIHLHLPHVIDPVASHRVLLALHLILNRYIAVEHALASTVVIATNLRVESSKVACLLHLVVTSARLPALKLAILLFMLVIDLAHLEISEKLLVLVDVGAVLAVVSAAHDNLGHAASILVIINPLHVALLKLVIIDPILVVFHNLVWTVVHLALELDLIGMEVVWLRSMRDVLEGTEGDAVVIVLVSNIDERVVLWRGVQQLLVMILLVLVAIEDGLISSREALLLLLIPLVRHELAKNMKVKKEMIEYIKEMEKEIRKWNSKTPEKFTYLFVFVLPAVGYVSFLEMFVDILLIVK